MCNINLLAHCTDAQNGIHFEYILSTTHMYMHYIFMQKETRPVKLIDLCLTFLVSMVYDNFCIFLTNFFMLYSFVHFYVLTNVINTFNIFYVFSKNSLTFNF